MTDLLTAFALLLVIEGVIYALLPDTMKRVVAQVASLPDDRLRWLGLAMVAAGVLLTWLVRG